MRFVPCPIHVGVDLIDSRAGTDGDPTHFFPAEREEFVAAIKSGKYDNPANIEPSAGQAHYAAGIRGKEG